MISIHRSLVPTVKNLHKNKCQVGHFVLQGPFICVYRGIWSPGNPLRKVFSQTSKLKSSAHKNSKWYLES